MFQTISFIEEYDICQIKGYDRNTELQDKSCKNKQMAEGKHNRTRDKAILY